MSIVIRIHHSSLKHEKVKSPTPEDLCQRRIKTLDIAFPVSRERVCRSSLLNDIRCLPGFEKVTETQVVQAAVNLMLSGELVPGDKHYHQLSRDFEKTIWQAIASRVELVTGACSPTGQHPSLVARQIELDIRTTLKSMNARGLPENFPMLQDVFLREGYVND